MEDPFQRTLAWHMAKPLPQLVDAVSPGQPSMLGAQHQRLAELRAMEQGLPAVAQLVALADEQAPLAAEQQRLGDAGRALAALQKGQQLL
jgi:hypothetical protein